MDKAHRNTAIVLIALYVSMTAILLYGYLALRSEGPRSPLHEIFVDGRLDDEERDYISGLTCEDLRSMLGTEEDVCLYFTDKEGNVVDLLGTGTNGIGCPSAYIDGKALCIRKP
jgi:hypothetical protein